MPKLYLIIFMVEYITIIEIYGKKNGAKFIKKSHTKKQEKCNTKWGQTKGVNQFWCMALIARPNQECKEPGGAQLSKGMFQQFFPYAQYQGSNEN